MMTIYVVKILIQKVGFSQPWTRRSITKNSLSDHCKELGLEVHLMLQVDQLNSYWLSMQSQQ
jgi:hypothetical protein